MDKDLLKYLLKYLFAWTPIVLVLLFIGYTVVFVNPGVGLVAVYTFLGMSFILWFFWGVWYITTGRKGK